MHSYLIKIGFISTLGSISLTGCQHSIELDVPKVALAAEYPIQHGSNDQRLTWADYIQDQQLIDLIQLALSHNHDLKTASLRVQEARAAYGIQKSELLPTLGATSSYERAHVPADLSPLGRSMTSDQYSIGLGMNQWELDLWGRIKHLNAAALQQFFAIEHNQIVVRNAIIQQVVHSYLTLSELEKRIYFAEEAIQNYAKSVEIFKRRYEVGAAAKVEYMQAQTLLSNGQNLLVHLHQQQQITANYLRLLVGQSIVLPQPKLDQITFKSDALATGLPSELLLHRADIRAAEAVLLSKHANIAAARAAFFPRISLTASIGTASTELAGLFQSGSDVWSFSPQITVPIFTAGRLKNNVLLAEIRRDLAITDYERTVKNAFKDVADALAQQQGFHQQLKIQQQGLTAFRESARLAKLRYDNGAASYLEVLDAHRSLLSAEQQWIETQSALLQSYVNLYFALGGDSQTPVNS